MWEADTIAPIASRRWASKARASRWSGRSGQRLDSLDALAKAADYIVLMAYDEHTRVNPAGPTASEEWAKGAVYWLLRHVDPHQVL